MSTDPVELPGVGENVAAFNDGDGHAVQQVVSGGLAPDGTDPIPFAITPGGVDAPGYPDVDNWPPALLTHSAAPGLQLGAIFGTWSSTGYTAGDLIAPPVELVPMGGGSFAAVGVFDVVSFVMADYTGEVDATTEFLILAVDGGAVSAPTEVVGDLWSPTGVEMVYTVARITGAQVVTRGSVAEVHWPRFRFMAPLMSGNVPALYGLLVGGGSGTSDGTDPGGGTAIMGRMSMLAENLVQVDSP